jgi:hypothetical protein
VVSCSTVSGRPIRKPWRESQPISCSAVSCSSVSTPSATIDTPVGIAVNISGRHLLSGQLTDHVSEALTASQVKPTQLILELTETVLLTDLPTVALEMQRLRSLGIRMAIDDFGTGYTSLAHLQHLTVDEIKIDRSFVQQLPDGRDSSLVRMVTELAHQPVAAALGGSAGRRWATAGRGAVADHDPGDWRGGAVERALCHGAAGELGRRRDCDAQRVGDVAQSARSGALPGRGVIARAPAGL